MIPMLKRILRTGIVSEPPPEALAAEQREAAFQTLARIVHAGLVFRRSELNQLPPGKKWRSKIS